MSRNAIVFCLAFAAAAELALTSPAMAQEPLRPSLPVEPPPGWNPLGVPQGPVVTLIADEPGANIQQLQDRWRTVCPAPCKLQLPAATAYRVGGPGLRATEPFWLPRPSGQVTLDARLGTQANYWTGFGMLMGGVPLAAMGLFWLLLASSFSSGSGPGAGAYVAGFVLVGVGAGLGIGGYSLWSANRSVVDVR